MGIYKVCKGRRTKEASEKRERDERAAELTYRRRGRETERVRERERRKQRRNGYILAPAPGC